MDRQRTAEARFQDKRSYWTNDGHEFLFGEDVRERRQQLYQKTGGRCEKCDWFTGWAAGHMHHKQGGLVGRCTCMHNLEWLCAECHLLGEHVQVRLRW